MGKSFNVLSIQSHVVHGYVGNKSATFPLQVLGFDVDAINTVQLSNHTGYKHFSGQKMDDKELKDVFNGIMDNDLLKTYTHLLTGYVGNDKFLLALSDVVKALRASNPDIIYMCDPVLGDNGKLYVPESFVGIYRDILLPLANISTPNQFEAELLSGIKIHSEQDAWQALDWFHHKGVQTVVLSSTNIGSPSHLKAFLSRKSSDGTYQRHSILMPKLGNCNFTGTGDLFAALFFAHYSLEAELSDALEKTVATVQAVITNTIKEFDPASTSTPTAHERELRIIKSKCDIENPVVTIKCAND